MYLLLLLMCACASSKRHDNAIDESVQHFSNSPHTHAFVEQTFLKSEQGTYYKPTVKTSYSFHSQSQTFRPKQPYSGTSEYTKNEMSSKHKYRLVQPQDERSQFLCLVLGICSQLAPSTATKSPFKEVFSWKYMDFDYDNDALRQQDIKSGYYVPHAVAPIDVDVFYGSNGKHRIFVTIPRFQVASPVTLGQVTSKRREGNPIIAPYPSWSWHDNPTKCNANRLVSVYRIKIDDCGRLWVLDTGKYGDTQTCDAQLLAFDLNTNTLLHKFTIPNSLLESRSILVTPTVDIRDKCENTFVYIADCQTYSILVYDLQTGRSWRATDKTMYPYPNFGTFKIQGDQFDLMDGVLGMDLEPYIPGRDRKLFYHAMSSPTENWMYTSDLRNESRFSEDPTSSPEIYRTFHTRRSSQSCAIAIDRNGISYFGLMSDTTMNCWNTASSEYGKYISMIQKDPVTLQFASGVKVINNQQGGQELWFMTSRFQKIATGTLNTADTNFRIHAGKIPEILHSTSCKFPDGFSGANPKPAHHHQGSSVGGSSYSSSYFQKPLHFRGADDKAVVT